MKIKKVDDKPMVIHTKEKAKIPVSYTHLLGGNEQSTHKYVSELLGKGTIDKKSSGETKGRQGSLSLIHI